MTPFHRAVPSASSAPTFRDAPAQGGPRRVAHGLFAAALAGTLAACGGGGGSSPAPAPPPTAGLCASGASAGTWADTAVTVGKTAGAVLAACTGEVTGIQWTQTAGPAVTVLSAQAQAIAFEPAAAGTYAFSVTYTDGTGAARTATVSVPVGTPVAASRVTARLDHAVRGGNAVSVRAWTGNLAAGETVTKTTWSQLEGTAVTLDTSDPARILFTAPTVAQDTLLRFRVTITTSAGATDSDDVAVLVIKGPLPATGNAAVWDAPLSPVHAYRRTGPYAAVLPGCVYNPQSTWNGAASTNLCPVGQLPLLGTETLGAAPTVAQVMNRVIVSHDWMGAVFEDFITNQDPQGDLKRMLNGVTAVVIGSHVRPSFYYVLTGAIYLDADALWLTPEQRDTINEAPDFRIGLDKDLGYTGLWRYVQNNVRVPTTYAANARVTRASSELVYDLGDLLFHELTHASDFIPPALRGALNASLTPWDNTSARLQAGQLPSDQLATAFPLQSAELKGLACVKFWGRTATATEAAYTPAQVGALFAADRASDEYNYSVALSGADCPVGGHSREDIAMLMEEFMLATRPATPVRRDVAFTNKFVTGMTGNDLFVAWGQRGRIGDAAIKPRVKLILPLVAPWIDPATVDTLPAPVPMRVGQSWNANVVLPGIPASPAGAPLVAERAPGEVDAARALLQQLGGARGGRGRLAVEGGAPGSTSVDGLPPLARRLGVVHR